LAKISSNGYSYKNGISGHNTIARIISLNSPNKFQSHFMAWMKDFHKVTEGSVIAIDDKTVYCSYNKSNKRGAIHMVSAFLLQIKSSLVK